MLFRIRPFSVADDLALCTEAENAAYLDTQILETSLTKKVEESLKRIEKQLNDGTYLGFTAVENGIPVGLIFVDTEDDTAFVDNFYVVPDRRGNGIGGELLSHILEALQHQGTKAIELMVTADNEIAVHLYEKLGFRISRFRMVKILD